MHWHYVAGDTCRESYGLHNVSILKELCITQCLSTCVYDKILRYFGHLMDLRGLSFLGSYQAKETEATLRLGGSMKSKRWQIAHSKNTSHQALDRRQWRNTRHRGLFLDEKTPQQWGKAKSDIEVSATVAKTLQQSHWAGGNAAQCDTLTLPIAIALPL